MFEPIGFVLSQAKEKTDHHWGSVRAQIVLHDDLADGLQGLEDFSHVIIVYHLHEARFVKERHLIRHPQDRADMPKIGIFSQRAKDRPNSIGITTVKLISVNQNILHVQGLDAIEGTPVLDIKPYYPQYDLKEEARVPQWVNRLMENYF